VIEALVTEPGTPHSARVERVAEEAPAADAVPIRVLEVGVCGTDREISEGLFGTSPPSERQLVLGHELLGVVERDGGGFTRGDFVTATVRRSCGRCVACAQGSPDSCLTGDYVERGITRLHGFARELVLEDPEQLIAVPRSLGRLGVLAEPGSICARGIRHARAVAGRQPWPGERALVLGAGAIGMLSTYLLRLEGVEVWTAARGPGGTDRAELVAACGARYVSTRETPLAALAEEIGGFDLVVEATGKAQVMAETIGLLRRNGVACLLGLDARERGVTLDGRTLGIDTVLQNRALLGSVNAHRQDWVAAVESLDQALARWPDAVERLVGLRVPLDRFAEAFAHAGVKATLVLSEGDAMPRTSGRGSGRL
jgi:glucose 1-dehydrogenase